MPEDVMNVYLVCSKYNLVGDLDLDSLVSLVFSAWMWIASYPGPFTRAVRASSGGKRARYPLLAHASIFRDFSETGYCTWIFSLLQSS